MREKRRELMERVAREVELGQWRWKEGWPQPGVKEKGKGGGVVVNGGQEVFGGG